MREIEVKLRVKDLDALTKKLAERGCELSAPIRQRDVVYTNKDVSGNLEGAKEGDVIIRIRHLGHAAELNMKIQRTHELDNSEYETEVSDPDATHHMLLALGYRPEVEVKKVRRHGRLGGYEICLDEVEELGNFVELEKLVPDSDGADPEVVRKELLRELESLGLSRNDEETRGYDTQLYQLRHNARR